MKKVKHWLHILLTILTSGLWLPVYVILLATTEMFNRGYREGKAAGRVERQAEIDATEYEKAVHGEKGNQSLWFGQGDATPRHFSGLGGTHVDEQGRRVIYDGEGDVRFGCTMQPVVPVVEERAMSRVDRFAELADRNRTVGLDNYERAEYTRLRQELSRWAP